MIKYCDFKNEYNIIVGGNEEKERLLIAKMAEENSKILF